MIKAETSNGTISLEMCGSGSDVLGDVFTIITGVYYGFEETEKGAGDRLLRAISEAIREGKIQEWNEQAKDLDAGI